MSVLQGGRLEPNLFCIGQGYAMKEVIGNEQDLSFTSVQWKSKQTSSNIVCDTDFTDDSYFII